MSYELHSEIAQMVTYGQASPEYLAGRFGADVIAAGMEQIGFMAKCLESERSMVVKVSTRQIGMDLAEGPSPTPDALVEKLNAFFLFLLYVKDVVPDDLEHLRYLQWRMSKHKHTKQAARLAALLSSAEAMRAVESVCSNERMVG